MYERSYSGLKGPGLTLLLPVVSPTYLADIFKEVGPVLLLKSTSS